MRSRRWALLGLAGLILLARGRAAAAGIENPGATLYFIPGLENFDELGRIFAVLGDVDQDGVKDFATSGMRVGNLVPPPARDIGHVDLYSGKTGALLRRWFGEKEYDDLGFVLGELPDIDGDGVLELGAMNDESDLFVLSPVTGETWYTIPRYHRLRDGYAVFLRSRDRDGDGVEEFIFLNTLAAIDYGERGTVQGRLTLHSGRTGRVLWEHLTTPEVGDLLFTAAPAGDFNGDGFEDVIVTVHARVPLDNGFPLALIGGADGALLDVIHVGDSIPTWGLWLASLGDHDGDGFPELAVAAPRYSLTVDQRRPDRRDDVGWVGVYHLPDFRLVWSATGRHRSANFGADHGDALGITLAPAADLDGDGAIDLFAGTNRTIDPAPSSLYPRFGRLYLYSGRTGEVLTVYEANHNLYEDGILATQVADSPFFQVVASLDDIDGDGHVDFLAGRPWNTNDARRIDHIGIVRAIRYRPAGPRFIRGDANGDGRVNIADAKKIILTLVLSETPACEAAYDLDGSRDVALDDAIYLLRSLFLAETGEPPPPYPECGRYDVLHPFVELGCDVEGTCAGE